MMLLIKYKYCNRIIKQKQNFVIRHDNCKFWWLSKFILLKQQLYLCWLYIMQKLEDPSAH